MQFASFPQKLKQLGQLFKLDRHQTIYVPLLHTFKYLQVGTHMAQTPHCLDSLAPEECRTPLHFSPGIFFLFALSCLPLSVVPELAGQPFFGTAALAASRGIAATGGTVPSSTGGPLSKGLSNVTNAKSDDEHKKLYTSWLLAWLLASHHPHQNPPR